MGYIWLSTLPFGILSPHLSWRGYKKKAGKVENPKRLALMFAGAMDSLLGAFALLAYFELLPFDVANWDIPRWVLGVVGAALFFTGVAVFTYQLTRNDSQE
jgi:hypothetical protein